MATSDRNCQGLTRAGKPCQAPPLKGTDRCSAHPLDPDSPRFGSPAQAREAGLLGGRPPKPRPSDVARELVEQHMIVLLRPYFRALGLNLNDDGSVGECEGPVKYVWAGSDEPAIPVLDLGAQMHAAEMLQDRIYGKPRQALEVSGADGGPVEQEIGLDSESREIIGALLRRRAGARPE